MEVGMKILIVEDNQKIRSMIRKIVEQNVPEIKQIIECDDGAEAIELYHKNNPDWVLMDIQLKEIDGLTATRSILTSDPDAKVVIVTQYDDQAYRRAARRAGVLGYLLKENLHELLNIILCRK